MVRPERFELPPRGLRVPCSDQTELRARGAAGRSRTRNVVRLKAAAFPFGHDGMLRSVQRQHRWWRRPESNRRPPGCKPDALPIELHPLRRSAAGTPRAPGRTRTSDPRLRKPTLCPLSYKGLCAVEKDGIEPSLPARHAGALPLSYIPWLVPGAGVEPAQPQGRWVTASFARQCVPTGGQTGHPLVDPRSVEPRPPGLQPGALPPELEVHETWHAGKDLNPRLAVLETAALAAELPTLGVTGGTRTRLHLGHSQGPRRLRHPSQSAEEESNLRHRPYQSRALDY